MSTTLKELVRNQTLAEGPDLATGEYDDYIDMELNATSNVELLERISDVFEYAAAQIAVRPRL